MCLKMSYFPDFGSYVKGCWEKSENYRLVSYPSVFCKIFEKLVNNRPVDYFEKCGHISEFSMVSTLLVQQ